MASSQRLARAYRNAHTPSLISKGVEVEQRLHALRRLPGESDLIALRPCYGSAPAPSSVDAPGAARLLVGVAIIGVIDTHPLARQPSDQFVYRPPQRLTPRAAEGNVNR